MSSREDENLSVLINSTLDTFGFKPEMISFRSHQFNKLSESMTSHTPMTPVKYSLVGSAGEGFRLLKSDVDILGVFTNTVCSDNPRVDDHLNILKTDYSGTAPGYTKIVLIKKSRHDIRHPFHFETMYKSMEGHPYIPCTMRYFVGKAIINGPAISLGDGLESYICIDVDWVFSFYFAGKELLRKWARRSRFYTWPQHTVLNEISKMEGYIVPVGDKLSDLESLEWRICYNTAEKKLVENLNVPHKKLYILLKMVSKTILKPFCKAITSYDAKNVVFWIAEGTPEQQCSVNFLVLLLQKSLYFMKYCLENNHLPNYMIPERNLLRGGVCGKEKQQTIDFLSGLLTEGGKIIVRIPKLHQCMSLMATSPDRALRYGNWRDEVETQTMKFIVKYHPLFVLRSPQKQLYFPFHLLWDMNFKKAMKYLIMLVPEFPCMLLQGKFRELFDLVMARLEATMLL